MKKLTLLVLTLLITSYAFSEVNTSYYENGQKSYERYYKNDKPHGLWTDWYENGQKSYETNYKNGKLGLETKWNENGQKSYEINHKNGKQHGLMTLWDENGRKYSEKNYKNNKLHGLRTSWYEDGFVGKTCYINGKKVALSDCGSYSFSNTDNNDVGDLLGSLLQIGSAYVKHKQAKSGNSYTPSTYTPPTDATNDSGGSSSQKVWGKSAKSCISFKKKDRVYYATNKCSQLVKVQWCISGTGCWSDCRRNNESIGGNWEVPAYSTKEHYRDLACSGSNPGVPTHVVYSGCYSGYNFDKKTGNCWKWNK